MPLRPARARRALVVLAALTGLLLSTAAACDGTCSSSYRTTSDTRYLAGGDKNHDKDSDNNDNNDNNDNRNTYDTCVDQNGNPTGSSTSRTNNPYGTTRTNDPYDDGDDNGRYDTGGYDNGYRNGYDHGYDNGYDNADKHHSSSSKHKDGDKDKDKDDD